MNVWVKSSLVVVGAIVLSTLAIQASDLLDGREGNLLGLVSESGSLCGPGAVQVNVGTGALCVDQYEAAPADTCPRETIASSLETQDNMNDLACAPQSASGKQPWRFVSLTQAQQLCARVGKRLPTNAEWYALALGQIDQSNCALATGAPGATGSSGCVTALGIADLVGNVWEWIDGQVSDGVYDGRTLPESGYVKVVDTTGIVVETDGTPSDDFNADYAKTNSSGMFGIIRGGYYASDTDGGVFAQNLAVPLDLKTDGVGFRCVRSVP